jgi:hypothetical protein
VDLERSGMRGRGVGFRVREKSGFSSLVQDYLLCLLIMHSVFQPSLRAIHDDLGGNFIIEETDKEFPKESICHALYLKIQVLKGNNKIFHCSILFQLGQMS